MRQTASRCSQAHRWNLVLLASLLCMATTTLAVEAIPRDLLVAKAVNSFQEGQQQEVLLENPLHTAVFGREGMEFRPRSHQDHAWHWSLSHIGTDEQILEAIDHGPVVPVRDELLVKYLRGPLVEQYVVGEKSIEQQFLIESPLPLNGRDLVIRGDIRAAGDPIALKGGWAWKDQAVTLGDVTVLDGHGQPLPATMSVSAIGTQITVDGAALASAVYPVLVDPVIATPDGADYKLTDENDNGPSFVRPVSSQPAADYDPINQCYLVVWGGIVDDSISPSLGAEREIYGRFFDNNVQPLGSNFKISNIGSEAFGAMAWTDIAYGDGGFYVVWETENVTPERIEIFGRKVIPGAGCISQSLEGQRLLSRQQPLADPSRDANRPSVAYNPVSDLFLVAWQSDSQVDGIGDDAREIFVRRVVASTGSPQGGSIRISSMGANDADANFVATAPDVVVNSTTGEYLVVWHGDDSAIGDGNIEVWGQLLNQTIGEIGDDFIISSMDAMPDSSRPNGFPDAIDPVAAYDSNMDEYLVVWSGMDDITFWREIYGQRVDADGTLIDANFRISDLGRNTNATSFDYNVANPDIMYNPVASKYLVVFYGEDNTNTPAPPAAKINDKFEVWGREIEASADNFAVLGSSDFRISFIGGGSPSLVGDNSLYPDLAYNSVLDQTLTVWVGRDQTFDSPDQREIYGRLFQTSPVLPIFVLDIDGDGLLQTGFDGNIVLTYLSGVTTLPDLVGGVGEDYIGPNATRTAVEIKALMDAGNTVDPITGFAPMDVDANGVVDLNTDGFMMVRYMAGLVTPNAVTDNGSLIGVGAARTAAEIAAYLESIDGIDY